MAAYHLLVIHPATKNVHPRANHPFVGGIGRCPCRRFARERSKIRTPGSPRPVLSGPVRPPRQLPYTSEFSRTRYLHACAPRPILYMYMYMYMYTSCTASVCRTTVVCKRSFYRVADPSSALRVKFPTDRPTFRMTFRGAPSAQGAGPTDADFCADREVRKLIDRLALGGSPPRR